MILYEKIGRRYFPVQDTASLDGLSNGSWLVIIEEGYTKCRHIIDDKKGLEVLAATTRWLEEWMSEELMKLSAYQYGKEKRKLTKKEQMAYDAYTAIMGKNHTMWMTKPAANDVVRAICKKLANSINTRSNHEI